MRITRAFCLGTTEVTAAQYDRFLDANGKTTRGGDGRRCPAGDLSWDDAVEFCRWLGKGRQPDLSPAHGSRVGIRLPGWYDDSLQFWRRAELRSREF